MTEIAIIGGGMMGVGIAHMFAQAGHPVRVAEPAQAARETLVARVRESLAATGSDPDHAGRVTPVATLEQAVAGADFVTEAVSERLDLKQRIFADLERAAPPEAILASNSSVIPISRIAQELASAGRMVGTHWWNPAPLIPLVEVVKGAATSEATMAATMALLEAIGKKPAYIRKDVPGFVGNRLQHALWREAIAMVAEGICDSATLDACIRNSFGQRLAVLGPLENADMVGLDLTLDIHRTVIPELDRHAGPHEFLQQKVADGELGFKTGSGFYSWSPEEMAALRERLTVHLLAARTNA